METLNERIKEEKITLEQLRRAQRQKKRNDREAIKKEENHRFFLLGKIAVEVIPVLRKIPVYKGKEATTKNITSVSPFKRMLSHLVANEEFMALLNKEIDRVLHEEPQ